MNTEIERCEVGRHHVIITLANGAAVIISSNEGYLNFHFSGIDDSGLYTSSCYCIPKVERLHTANNLDIAYHARIER